MAIRFKSVIAFLAAVVVVATAACASDPASNIDATIEAGIAATMVGVEIEKAVKATMAPSLAKEHFNRGFTYVELGEYRKAIQEYDKVIQLDRALPWPTTTVVMPTANWANTSGPYRTGIRLYN